jgi:hypothetical protein
MLNGVDTVVEEAKSTAPTKNMSNSLGRNTMQESTLKLSKMSNSWDEQVRSETE